MNNNLLIYLLTGFLFMFISVKTSYKLNLVDTPSKRKIHSKATVFTGGIIVSIIYIFSIWLFNLSDNYLNTTLSIAFLISLVGLIDDKYNLNVGGKLSLQIIPIFYLIIYESLFLTHLGDYTLFKLELGAFSIPFSLISILFLINSFNYFDGMDGTLSLASVSTLAILYFLIPDQSFRTFIIIVLIPIGIFLCFNLSFFSLPKVFLGDSGSLLIGFIVSFLLIYLAKKDLAHPILLAWSVSIFVYEFLSLNIIRLKKKKNPFIAGQDHLHHILFSKSKSVFMVNFYICLLNIFLFSLGYFSYFFLNSLSSLILFITSFIIFFIFRKKYSKNNFKIKIN